MLDAFRYNRFAEVAINEKSRFFPANHANSAKTQRRDSNRLREAKDYHRDSLENGSVRREVSII